MIEMQERMRPGRAIDIDYLRLVADPVGTSMAVFDRLGLATSGDVEDRLRRRLSVERVHERSAASYSLHQFGLTEAGIHEATSAYSEWVERQAML
jgi:hypothetical protein